MYDTDSALNLEKSKVFVYTCKLITGRYHDINQYFQVSCPKSYLLVYWQDLTDSKNYILWIKLPIE